ncbi:phosphate ABC transporter permease PstA [Nanchangia anserum]|uniref:Phosphate transport system permease protein PstA n=1 Tax=Nanchangia anserum TaxID=2692125 RepID=A0A8I0GCZ5_9ACTO|nr:phosphate ABC transporter permease PstA [Nanchangia anserum]MBD3689283.1 phosphate ABC transporter permease PstA [Nanchangia anserum]QOX81503.1 phosphate ABC transporter permease PstA [Nanchangia anserum]
MTMSHALALAPVDARHMRRRKLTDALVRGGVIVAFALAVIPLVSLLATIIVRGAPRLFADFPYFLTVSMKGVFGGMDAGGIYHALLGTVLVTAWACLISVPIGILAAVFLVEYGHPRPLARALTFFVDVMTGIPSIVAGLFAAAVFALSVGPGYRAGIMGAAALSVLMVPTIVRSTEEMLRMVPSGLREAAYALGVPKWKVTVKVVLRTAFTGIITGIILGIARVIGETAPLLVTVGTFDAINTDVFNGRMMTLPVYVYRQYAMGEATCAASATSCVTSINEQRAWSAALVLLAVVVLINCGGRWLAHMFQPKGEK